MGAINGILMGVYAVVSGYLYFQVIFRLGTKKLSKILADNAKLVHTPKYLFDVTQMV